MNNFFYFWTYRFEKYISGKYLGEFVRVILAKLSKDGLLFTRQVPESLLLVGSFLTDYISLIEQ